MVDDGGYASYQFPILVSHEVFGFTKFEGCVFSFVERVKHVVKQVGNRVWVVFVQFVVEADEALQFSFVVTFLIVTAMFSTSLFYVGAKIMFFNEV